MKVIELLNHYKSKEITNQWNLLFDMQMKKDNMAEFIQRLNNKELKKSDGEVAVYLVEEELEDFDDYYTTSYLENGKYYGMDFMEWGRVLNSQIKNDTKLDNLSVLCHILWEMTWHGWYESDIQSRATELEEMVEKVENGEAELYTLDELLKALNEEE